MLMKAWYCGVCDGERELQKIEEQRERERLKWQKIVPQHTNCPCQAEPFGEGK